VAVAEIFLKSTHDLFAIFVQQQNNVVTDAKRRAGFSAIAELLVETESAQCNAMQ